MKRASFFLFDSFTSGIVLLLFTTFLFAIMPTFSDTVSAKTELTHIQQALIQSGELSQFISSGSDTQIQTYIDNSLPVYLCANISYFDDTGSYIDSVKKSSCSSSTQNTLLYGTLYVDDLFIVRLEGWYE